MTNRRRHTGAYRWMALGLLALAMGGSACGSDLPMTSSGTGGSPSGGGAGDQTTGPSDSCDNPPTGLILPFAEGNSWTYAVTDVEHGTTTSKSNEIQGLEAVGVGSSKDLQVNKVLTTKKDGTDKTVSWQAVVDDKIVRYREDAYSASEKTLTETDFWDPYRLHVDGSAEHTVEGAGWTDAYKESKHPVDGQQLENIPNNDRWTTVKACELIDVPAGKGPDGSTIPAAKRAGIRFRKITGSNTKEYVYVRGVGKVLEQGAGQTEKLTGYTIAK